MTNRAAAGVLFSAFVLGGCFSDNEAVVFVEPSVESPTAKIEGSVLGVTVSGTFDLVLPLGPRASGPSQVLLGSVAITDAENQVSVVPSLSLVSSMAFPVTVEPDSEVKVGLIFDIGEKTLAPQTKDALCLPAGVRIAGTIKDSLEDAATPFASDTFKPTGCM
jgi:hypothetical protein